MFARVLLFVVVVGGLWLLLFGLTDRQIDAFQAHRRAWLGGLRKVERTTTSGLKKITN